jgi:hypothetical protein
MLERLKTELKDTEKQLKRYISSFKLLMIEYDCRYNMSDDEYYNKCFLESGYNSEGLFSLNHTPLSIRKKENRKERNILVISIKETRKEFKEIQRKITKITCN